MDNLLQQGVIAYRAGKRDEARKFFIAAVKQNQNDERAWGWMYNVANNDQERIYCLKQILRNNHQNEKANKLLNELSGFEPPLEMPQTGASTKQNQRVVTPQQSKPPEKVTKKQNSNTKILAILIGVVFLFFCCIALPLLSSMYNNRLASTSWRATLDCAECAALGMDINLWSKPGALPRGAVVVGSVQHGTECDVTDRQVVDDVLYYYVVCQRSAGWLDAVFIKR